MQEIIDKANELGHLIKESDVYKRYFELSEKVNNDSEARFLVKQFTNYSQMLAEKERHSYPVESWEKEEYQNIVQQVSENELITEFMEVQTEFMELMRQIQEAISEVAK